MASLESFCWASRAVPSTVSMLLGTLPPLAKLLGLIRCVLELPAHPGKALGQNLRLVLVHLATLGQLLLLLHTPCLRDSLESLEAEEPHSGDRALGLGNLSFCQCGIEFVIVAQVKHPLEDALGVGDLGALRKGLVVQPLVLLEASILQVQVDLSRLVLGHHITVESKQRQHQNLTTYTSRPPLSS